MKTKVIFAAALAAPTFLLASVADPIADFKTGLTIPAGDKILKWECDVNGDGKKEVLLSLKSESDNDAQSNEPSGWVLYVADTVGSGFSRPVGIELKPQSISSILPNIDPEACFVGQITELGKRGIVTMRIDSPREGESIGTIYAFTIEGDHLKRTELAQYVIAQGPHALFTKYLANNKRTHVTLQEVSP